MVWIIAVVLVVVLLAAGVAIVLRRRPAAAVPPPQQTEVVDDSLARLTRQRALEPHEDELLTRRVDLDARRGTLGGDVDLLDAFERLDAQRRAGSISEDIYEAEKVRLLGG